MDFRKPIRAAHISVHDWLAHSLPLGIACARSVILACRLRREGLLRNRSASMWLKCITHTEMCARNRDTARRSARASLGIKCTCCFRQTASSGAVEPDRNMHLVRLKPSTKSSALPNIALMLISLLSLNIAQLPPQSRKILIFITLHIATQYLLSQILNELIYGVQPSFLAPQKLPLLMLLNHKEDFLKPSNQSLC